MLCGSRIYARSQGLSIIEHGSEVDFCWGKVLDVVARRRVEGEVAHRFAAGDQRGTTPAPGELTPGCPS